MNAALTPSLLEEVRAAYEQKSDLPSPVHVTANDGRFLYANAEARALFGLGDDPTQHNIANLYEDEKERRFVLRELKKVRPGQWRKNFKALLVIQGSRLKVRFVSKPFFDEKGEIVAMLNLTEGMSRVEWYADLEDELEVGLFVIDRQLKVADCNHFLADMLGFESTEDIKGKPVTQFMWEPESASALLKTLLETPKLRKEPMKLKRRDGAMVLIEMSCEASSLEAGEISRIRGVVKDITFKVFYDDLPVGLFLINNSPSGEDIISQVNLTFAKMHGFETVASVLGKPSDIFQGNPLAYAAYKEELNRASKENRPLLDYYMEIIDNHGKKKNVVVNVRFMSDQKGQIRVGAVYDLTDHVGKRERMLKANFSAILHAYIATAKGLRDTLSTLVQAHGRRILQEDNKTIDTNKTHSELKGDMTRFEAAYSELKTLPNASIKSLENINKYWSKFSIGPPTEKDRNLSEEDVAIWGRFNLIEILKELESLRKQPIRKEILRKIRIEVDDMLRIGSMTSLSTAVAELNERIYDFMYLRDFLLKGDPGIEDFKRQNIVLLLSKAIRYLKDFAITKNVDLKTHFALKDEIWINCHSNSLVRAVQNLLHNAIKYSWQKGPEYRAWVDIWLEKKDQEVDIIIENWGVPIRKEELENDAIFEFGRRGRESDDRGRSGTGIGLSDSMEVVKRHGGNLQLFSEPISGNAPTNYSNPFRTKAIITLPIIQNKNDNN